MRTDIDDLIKTYQRVVSEKRKASLDHSGDSAVRDDLVYHIGLLEGLRIARRCCISKVAGDAS